MQVSGSLVAKDFRLILFFALKSVCFILVLLFLDVIDFFSLIRSKMFLL